MAQHARGHRLAVIGGVGPIVFETNAVAPIGVEEENLGFADSQSQTPKNREKNK